MSTHQPVETGKVPGRRTLKFATTADIRLLSQQPRIEAGIPDDGLVLEPSTIETVVPDSMKK